MTAIKMGLYGIYMEHQFDTQASPKERELYKCVSAFSLAEGRIHQEKCGVDRACFDAISSFSKEEIFDRITAIQNFSTERRSRTMNKLYDACKAVDIAKQ